MTHKLHQRKRGKSLKRNFKRMAAAAAVAGAAFVSSTLLPGMPATAHASPIPDAPDQPDAAVQQMAKTPQGPLQTDSKTPVKKVEATPVSAKAETKAPDNFQKVVDVKATAYAPGAHDNDQWGEKTFLGTTVRPGIVAVDPNVIPLGSRLYIQYPDGTGHYATAEDTGGAIKGNRIDVALSSVDKANDFGIKNVKVYVLGKA